jgi:DNA-directed RNA polymerase I subunit RPA2
LHILQGAAKSYPVMQIPKKSGKVKGEIKETCPSFRRGHLAHDEDIERLRVLTEPHVGSFNYFLEEGLARGIKDIEPAEMDILDMNKLKEGGKVDLSEVSTVKFWMEDVKIAKPTKAAGGRSNKLIPRECRERKIIYAGQIFGKFCYRIIQRRNGVEIAGPPTKIAKTFGNMPIMVLSKACHLEGMMAKELIKVREEVSV